ncbi:MAG: DNA-binding NtrC family response regulator [Myxococcota bacterium]|jgi:DNA-binding NtrC family response regulator
MSNNSTLQTLDWLATEDEGTHREHFGLALVWSLEEPGRLGEVVLPTSPQILGREKRGPGRCVLLQMRPGRTVPTGPLGGRTISRDQLAIAPERGGLSVRNIGRGTLLVNGVEVESALVRAGDLVEIVRKAIFLIVRRPPRLPPAPNATTSDPFGLPDRSGIVGESPATWRLRESLAFAGPRDAHTLLLGDSGTGKELAARALHSGSPRADSALVSRSAATLPEGLIDAELFGNAQNYPNPGMPERPGLVGAADGGSLFLDEIGELSHSMQARLLRVLDSDGEYQRLGEAGVRRSDLRLIAATNRSPEALKHDLNARFRLQLSLPPLQARREDIPLLAYHLLRSACQAPDLAERFMGEGGFARVSPTLMFALLRHEYTHHVRELDRILWASLSSSPGRFLDLTEDARARLIMAPSADSWRKWVGHSSTEIPADALQSCLDDHNGSQQETWQALGLESRYQLSRLIKKHGLTISKVR